MVVVTGASAGVGRATARAFARGGARLGLLARGGEGLERAREEAGDALAIPTDVAVAEEVERAAAKVEDEFGPIDVWVNNAMATVFAPFAQLEPDEYRRATEVTYLETVYGTMAALRRMLPRDHGTIVQVGSALAYRGIPLQAPYCGAKHAIQGFTESLRCELLHDRSRVHVTMVQLPALNTPAVRGRAHEDAAPPEGRTADLPTGARRRRHRVGRLSASARGRRRRLDRGGDHVGQGRPLIGDVYLSRRAYEAQQTDEPVERDRPDNLFEPVPGDHGARGIFDAEARSHSIQFLLTKHRETLLSAAALAAIALARRS